MSSTNIMKDELPLAMELLSAERMAKLCNITGNDRNAIILHHKILIVASALMPVTAILEICLRNTINKRLSSLFGDSDDFNWLQNIPQPFQWKEKETQSIHRARQHAQRAIDEKTTSHDKKELEKKAFPNGVLDNLKPYQRDKKRQEAIQINKGQYIAQLTLGFWKRLFSSDYEAALWNQSLKRIFPDKSLQRKEIAINLENIHKSRNRIAHHEPLYGDELKKTIESIAFIAKNFDKKASQSPTLVETLIKSHQDILNKEASELNAMFLNSKASRSSSS